MKLFYEGYSMAGPEGISIQNNKLSFYHDMRGIREDEIPKDEIDLTPKQISKLSKFIDKMEIWDWHKDYDKFHLFHPMEDGYNWKIKIEIDNKKISSKGYEIYPDNFFKLLNYFDQEFGTEFDVKDWEKGDLEEYKFNFKFDYAFSFDGQIRIFNKNRSLIYECKKWSKELKKKKKIFICHNLIKSFEDFFNQHRLWDLPKNLNHALQMYDYRDGDHWDLKVNFADKKMTSSGLVLKFKGFEEFISFLNSKFDTDIIKDINND